MWHSFESLLEYPEVKKSLPSKHDVLHVCITHPISGFCNSSVGVCELLYSNILI